MTFANVPQPRRPGSPARRIGGEVGLVAMWLGFASLVFAVAVAFASPTASGGWAAKGASPLILIDLLAILIHLRSGGQRSGALSVAGIGKLVVVFGLSMVVIIGGPYRGPMSPTPFDDLVPAALFLSGPLTLLAGVLRRHGR